MKTFPLTKPWYATIPTLMRWPNLLIVAGTQVLLYYILILPFLHRAAIEVTLGTFNFFLLVLTTVLIAAGGYVINDIYDQEIDRINKPERMIIGNLMSEPQAWQFYGTLTFAGGLLAAYLGWSEDKMALLPIYPLAVGILWYYAAKLKRQPLLGNLVVSLFCAFVAGIIWIGEWEAWQVLGHYSPEAQHQLTALLFAYLWFAFASTLYRELIKDLEDQAGDAATGCRTLPIILGTKRAKIVTTTAGIVLLLSLFGWIYFYHGHSFSAELIYLLIGVVLPLVWSIQRLSRASTPEAFHQLSQWAKFLMLSGLIYFLLL